MKNCISKFKRLLCDMNMAKKLSLLLSLTIAAALFATFRMNLALYDRDMKKASNAVFTQISIQFETVMKNTISNMNAIAKAPLYATKMQDELRQSERLSDESVSKMQQAADIFAADARLHHVIALYDSSGRVAFSSATSANAYLAKQYYDKWYQIAEAGGGGVCITGFPAEEPTFACTAVRMIKGLPQMDTVGMIAISVPRTVFDKACAQIENISGGVAVVFNAEGDIVYASQPIEDRQTVDTIVGNVRPDQTQIDAGGYLGYYAADSAGRYAILVYTSKAELMAGQARTGRIMAMLCVLACIMVTLVIMLVTSNTTRPLRKITKLMMRVQGGDRSVRFHALYQDEVGILGRNFNQMLDKMDEMTRQVVAVSTSKKQAEIDALQGQINPHFMYNTLECFRMMAVEKDDFELAELLCSFGKMLRYNVTTMNESTTLRQELTHLAYFIRVQNARHTQKIRLACEVPPELMEYSVIKLLLQPIVENAVLHGLEMVPEREGVVTIRARQEADTCIIDVLDNGLGMSGQTLAALRESICIRYADAKQTSHIGLRNVNERIRLYYGEGYGLEVDSWETVGTQVRITLPYENREDCGKCGIS